MRDDLAEKSSAKSFKISLASSVTQHIPHFLYCAKYFVTHYILSSTSDSTKYCLFSLCAKYFVTHYIYNIVN